MGPPTSAGTTLANIVRELLTCPLEQRLAPVGGRHLPVGFSLRSMPQMASARFAPGLFHCAKPSNFMDLFSVTEMRICDTLFN